MLQLWMRIAPDGPEPIVSPPIFHGPDDALVAVDTVIAGNRYLALLSPGKGAERCVVETPSDVTLKAGKTHCDPAVLSQGDEDDPLIRLDRHGGDLELFLPVTSVTQLFHTRRGKTLLISTDPRLLYDPELSLDDHGIYCLLQFGALTPPYTIWRQIRRFLPGRITQVSAATLDLHVSDSKTWDSKAAGTDRRGPQPGPRQQEDWVAQRLDASLVRLCPDKRPLILYSGGVDSGLLAARAAALGWNDTLLANYSMGPGDRESALAEAMAKHLGLSFWRKTDDPTAWTPAMDRIGASYTQPLGDYSTIPTYLLTQAVAERAGDRRTILDGSGADGVFGVFAKIERWARAYALPNLVRRSAAAGYRIGKLWASPHRYARYLAAARMSGQMPHLLASMMAENPLEGIAYHIPEKVRRAVHRQVSDGIAFSFALPGDDMPYRGLDIRHLVCDFTAQKDGPVLLGSSLDIAYPFLAPPVVRFGLQETIHWPEHAGESKAVLKRLLARQVPADMVYRPKSGFTPPIAEELGTPEMSALLHEFVLGADAPLRGYLDMRVVTKVVHKASTGAVLPHTTYNFLWTLLFTTLWMHQVAQAFFAQRKKG